MRHLTSTERAVRWLGSIVICAATMVVGTARAEDIVIGQIGPFTVLPSPDANEMNQGAQAYFDLVNEAGGIAKRRISFFKLDDKYSADEFAKQVDIAIGRKAIALISPVGSAVMQKLVLDKLLDKSDLVVLNALPGAEVFRKPGHPRLFHIRAGDGDQIAKIVQHIKTLGVGRLEVLYQDVATGTSGLAIAKEVGQSVGVQVEGVSSKADTPTLTVAAKAAAATQPEATLVLGAPRFMAESAALLRKAGVASPIFAVSYLPPPLLVKLAGEADARGVAITQAFPNPNGKILAIQREFQETMKKYAPTVASYNAFHLEGYICARVLVEALRRGGTPSSEQLAKNLHSMGPLDVGGFTVDFSKGNIGGAFVDIGMVSTGGRLLY